VRRGYQAHDLVDGGKARITLQTLVTPAKVPEECPADLAWRARFRWQVWPRQAASDTTYAPALIRALEDQRIRAYTPLPAFDARTPFFGKRAFVCDARRDAYTCPHGATLCYRGINRSARILLDKADTACAGRLGHPFKHNTA